MTNAAKKDLFSTPSPSYVTLHFYKLKERLKRKYTCICSLEKIFQNRGVFIVTILIASILVYLNRLGVA